MFSLPLTIITLTKNDNLSFDRILKSILEQEISCQIEWPVVDTSKENNKELCKFYLGGLISNKTPFKILKELLLNKKISYLRKFIFLIKYLLITNLFNIYNLMQFLKSKIINLIL